MLHHLISSSTRVTSPDRRSSARRLVAGSLLAGLIVASGARAASAHVRVNPDVTESGRYSQLTFRVPNESPTAGTVKVAVTLPQDTPFTSVSTRPVAGWTATVTKAALPSPVDVGGATITEAARTVTWTAGPGVQIRPGEYQEFPISVGPLPAPGQLVLPAEQTYSDGTVVDWSQTGDGKAEPDHPAPMFTVTASSGTGGHGTAASGTAASADGAADTTGSDPAARWMGGAALLLSIVALGLAQVRSSRSKGAASTSGVASDGPVGAGHGTRR